MNLSKEEREERMRWQELTQKYSQSLLESFKPIGTNSENVQGRYETFKC